MDNNKLVPELTLTPNVQASADSEILQTAQSAQNTEPMPTDSLSPEELAMVEQFAAKIDVTDPNIVLNYGVGAQQKVANFSDNALANVQTKDLGEVGDMISDLVGELREFDAEEKSGFFGLFKSKGSKISQFRAKYEKADVNIEKITAALESHQVRLMKDVAILDQLYEVNLTNFKELSMYILAGKKRLEEVRSGELVQLTEKAKKVESARGRAGGEGFERQARTI